MNIEPITLVLIWTALAVGLRFLLPTKLTAVLLAVVVVCSSVFLIREHGQDLWRVWNAGRQQVLAWTEPIPAEPLPQEVGIRYPNLELVDAQGAARQLSEFQGKIIILETIGMNCPTSIAFSGGRVRGPFLGMAPQPNLDSIESYLKLFGGIDLDPQRIVLVQLLVFDPHGKAPTPQDVRAWTEHFNCRPEDGVFVFAAHRGLTDVTDAEAVPGFYLIDQDFVFRAHSSRSGGEDLYKRFIPQARELFREKR